MEDPLSWVQKKVDRATEAASEWFKVKTGLRDVMPKGTRAQGKGEIQGAEEAGSQGRRQKVPYRP